jgi:hypothetical protein
MDRGFVHECPLPPDHFKEFETPDFLTPPSLDPTIDLSAKYREQLGLPFGNNTEDDVAQDTVSAFDLKKALRSLLQNLIDIACNPVFESNGFVKAESIRTCSAELNKLILRYRAHQAKEELILSAQKQLSTLRAVEVDLTRFVRTQ